MKIYFAGSIRGGRNDAELYLQIINHLKKYGRVLSEHVGNKKLALLGEDGVDDNHIHNRDLEWVLSCDVMIAEVSTPSLGVGYEIRTAVENNKKVLCLYRQQKEKKLSAMISGCSKVTIAEYHNFSEISKKIDGFFKNQLIS